MNSNAIKKVTDADNNVLAIIVPSSFRVPGVSFFTDDDSPQQLAFINQPKGKQIAPHSHNAVSHEVIYTQETLFIREGVLRVDFYSDNKEYVISHLLSSGDVILLIMGGHGFEVIEEVDMIEVRPGPYVKNKDKTLILATANDIIIQE
ncbi:hypothetical protein ACFL17_00775 [Pseudomonadota bacterium]